MKPERDGLGRPNRVHWRACALWLCVPGVALADDADLPGGPAAPPHASGARVSMSSAKSDLEAAIDEIVVTATRVAQPVRAVPQSTSVVTAEELRTRPVVTLAECLREEPGLWVQKTGHSGGSPILRGQIGNRVLYLWDGVRINNGALFGGPNAFFNQLPWAAVERVEVVRGPGSVQYGSDAIGGVVNVVTKRPGEFTETPTFAGSMSTRYGSVDQRKLGSFDLAFAERDVSVLVGAMSEDVNDYAGGGGFGDVDQTSFSNSGCFGKVGWRLDDTQRVGVSWQKVRREDIEAYIQSKLNPSGVPRLFTPAEERSLLKLDYAARGLRGLADDVDAYAYWHAFDAVSDRTTESSTAFRTTTTKTAQDMYGTGVQAVRHLGGDGRIVAGADVRKEVLGASRTLVTRTKATGAITVEVPQGSVPDGTYDVVGAFVLGEFGVTDGLRVFPGVRVESAHIDADPVASDTSPGFTLDDLDLDERWNSLTWSIGATQRIAEGIDLVANVATGFRAPNFNDTLSFGPGVFSSTSASIPSPGVEPEKSLSWEAGPRVAFGAFDASASAWWTDLKDLIQSEAAGTVNVPGIGVLEARQGENTGRAELRGLDLAARYRLDDGWTLLAQYSQAHGQDTQNGVPLRFVPPRNALFTCRWDAPGGRLSIEGTARVVDRKKRHAPDDEEDAAYSRDPAYGSPNTTNNPSLRDGFEVPGHSDFGVRASYRLFEDDRRSVDLFLAVENLTAKRYREAFSRQAVEPGRNIVFGIDVKF